MSGSQSLNGVLEKWNKGLPAINAWLQVPSSLTAEAVASLECDSVTIDLQHGMIDFRDSLHMFQAISSQGKTGMARVASNDPAAIGQALDAGALGIICPLVNDATEAKDFVSSCLYPPLGKRSFGPTRAQFLDTKNKYFDWASTSILKLAMIETKEGLSNVEDIVKTENLDGIFIGPYDLGIGLGCDPQDPLSSPVLLQAIQSIRKTAHDNGKRVGIFCANGEQARKLIEDGFDMVCPGFDLGHMIKKYSEELSEASGFSS